MLLEVVKKEALRMKRILEEFSQYVRPPTPPPTPFDLARALNDVGLPGVRFRAHSFTPTFQKQAGKVCGGVELHVTDRQTFEPFRTGLYCTKIARDLDPLRFDWRSERYEFVTNRPAIDLLAGTDRFRQMVDKGEDIRGWIEEWRAPLKQFDEERKEFLLYK